MSAIYILWLREVKRYTRSKAQIIASLGQPILYLFVLGHGLGPVFQKAGSGSYLQFVAPGVVAMTVLFTAMFSGMTLLWDRQFGLLRETLIAPVSRVQIVVGRTCGAATVAILQGLLMFAICLLAGFRPISLGMLPMAFLFVALIAVVFAGLATTLGSSLNDMQTFQLVTNLLVLPIFFLSGALFPLAELSGTLTLLTSLDPLSYGVDGLRATLLAQPHFGMAADAVVLGLLGVTLVALGAWRFAKIEI